MKIPKSTRREFLSHSSKALMALTVAFPWRIDAAPAFDIVFKGGTILDGTGASAFRGDVGIAGDSIRAIGKIAAEQGRQVVDISGLHVCPGFIDIHSHSDGSILSYPGAESRIRQGITTELTGNCGGSAAPLQGLGVEERKKEWKEDEVDATWSDVASYFTALERTKIAVNQALIVGQGTIRESVVGLVDRKLKPEELERVLSMVESALDQGAFGISTGLEYVPGRYTPTEEIVAMALIVGRRGGLYASHIRNEVSTVTEAVSEAIDIGRRTGARVEISHLKACGRRNWPKQRGTLDLIESARADGVNVLADAYPYTAYSTGLSVVLDSWALEGGDPAMTARLRNPSERARIRKEVLAYVDNEPGDYDLIVISSVGSEKNRSLVGKNIKEIAQGWKMEPVDALLRLLDEEQGSVSYIGHAMSPENVEMVLSHPLVMVSTDGYAMAPKGKALQSRPHPRSYGTYPRALGHYSRERKAFDLPTAIRKMTSMPADQIGISDRGRISAGKKADLVVFDSDSVKDNSTFQEPHKFPSGVRHVMVNGTMVLKDGEQNDSRPGRVLRRT